MYLDNDAPEILEYESRMEDRQRKITGMQDQMNKKADEIFADFCAEIGVRDIRYSFSNFFP